MSTSEKNVRFYELLEVRLLSEFRKKFLLQPLNADLVDKTRLLFNEIITNIFSQSKYTLTPAAVTWISEQFLKTVKIDDVALVNTLSEEQVKLSELSFDEIQLFKNLFDVTVLGPELRAEYQRRNLS